MGNPSHSSWPLVHSEDDNQSSIPLVQQDVFEDSTYHHWHSKQPHSFSLSSIFRATVKSKRLILRILFGAVSCLVFLAWWHFPGSLPLYEPYKLQENMLPQNRPGPPLNGTQEVKYFLPAHHANGMGWGNALQELFLNAHLAHLFGRSFVWDDYTWTRDGQHYSFHDWKLIPSHIPLSALIQGPINGGKFPPGDDSPLSISKDRFSELCPSRKTITLPSNDMIAAKFGLSDQDSPADIIFFLLTMELETINDPCVEVNVRSSPIFGYGQFEPKMLLGIWSSLSKSPMVTSFDWSPLIYSIFNRNHLLLDPSSLASNNASRSTIPGLLALHIRRGDFEGHCKYLSRKSAHYNSFNSLPELPDRFVVPSNNNLAAKEAAYALHCYPTIPQIVAKVRSVREENQGLRNIFLMTEGKMEWIAELTDALMSNGPHWDAIHSSRELELTWEEKYVDQAVETLIGQKAEVFVGNGFSSLTSNIVMLRASKKLPMSSMRFW